MNKAMTYFSIYMPQNHVQDKTYSWSFSVEYSASLELERKDLWVACLFLYLLEFC